MEPQGPTTCAAETKDCTLQQELPLQRSWVFWMHKPCFEGNYEDTRKPLHANPITSVQDFWRYYNNIPEPSRFFYQDGERKTVGGVTLEGWSFFEGGVKPDWEDPRNAKGNTITFRASYTPQEIDKVWKFSLVGLVGETIDPSEHVTGIRLIDRGANYRLEVWTDSNDDDVVNRAKVWFQSNVMSEVKSVVTCFTSPHESDKKPPVVTPHPMAVRRERRPQKSDQAANGRRRR